MDLEQGKAPKKPRHVMGKNEKLRKGDRDSALIFTDPIHSCNPF